MHPEGFRRLGAALAESTRDREPLEALAETGRAYRRAALASRSLYGLMFGPPPPAGFEPSPEDREAVAATYHPLVDAVRRCTVEGVLRGDPDRIAAHLWAVAHGMVSLELAGRLPVDAADADQVYDEALGLAAAPFLAAS